MNCAWLPELLVFNGDWDEHIKKMFHFFNLDFIATQPTYRGCVVHISTEMSNGYPETFWHILQGGKGEDNNSVPQARRWERIRWPRPIIVRTDIEQQILVWEMKGKSGNNNRGKRYVVKIYFPEARYFILMLRRKKYVNIITAYPTSDYKHNELMEEYDAWLKNTEGRHPEIG